MRTSNNYNILVLLILQLSLILFGSNVHAGIGDELDSFYNSLGGTTNVTNPSFTKSQKAGYLTLGGIQARAKIDRAQIASIQIPSARAGCGGIDFFGGGFSFIDSDQIIELMNNIGSNAAGPLAQMAVEQFCPQCSSIIKYFQNLAREVNALNINSCSAAKTLLSDPGSIIQTAKTTACRVGGAFTDAADASEKCTSGGKTEETAADLKEANDPVADQYPVGNTNIAWKALMDTGYFSSANDTDMELAEMLMTMSGTMVVINPENDNETTVIESYLPKMEDEKVIQALLEGSDAAGKIDIMTCASSGLGGSPDYQNCLVVTEGGREASISAEQSYLGRVDDALTKLTEAIEIDSEDGLDTNVAQLLAFSSLPIHSILNIHAAYYSDSIDIGSISEFIAMDMLYGYLGEINKTVRIASMKFNTESFRKVFKGFFDHQEALRKALSDKQAKLSNQFTDYYEIIERTAMIESMLSQDLSAIINTKK